MDTLAPAVACVAESFPVSTAEPTCFIDLTERLDRFVARSGIEVGLLTVQTRHTTTALVVNEDEPLLLADFHRILEAVAPRDAAYCHDDLSRRTGIPPGEPRNGHAHCRALLLPTSAGVNIVQGRLALGRWQRVFLVELDGPRHREVSAFAIGATL